MNTLFIGGFADGRMIDVDDKLMSVNLYDVVTETPRNPQGVKTGAITAVLYHREFLTSKNGKTYSVMFTGGGCLLQKLLDNYKPQVVPK